MPVSLHLMWVPWGCPLSQVRRVAGSAALVLVDGVTPLRPEPALFESMLEGWGRQQRSRRLSGPLIESRVNRPGFCGGSQSTGEWEDGSSTEVSGRAA